MTKYVYVGVVAGFIFLSGVLFEAEKYHASMPQETKTTQNFGNFTPVQASQFTLAGAGVTNSQTTIQLASFALPDPNKTLIQMSMFGAIGYGVIEPQSSKIENVSFTGVTQNANGSATLTGVSRGLSFYAPFAASSSIALSHAGGSTFILSNSGAFYGQQFLFANNNGTSSAILVFASTSMPRYDLDPGSAAFTLAPGTVFVSMDQLSRTAIAGASNATRFIQGLVQVAFRGQAASSTSLGATGAFAALTSDIATSSPSIAMSTSSVVMTGLDSRINPLFMSTSTGVIYTLGNLLINSSSTFMGVTTLFSTTSIAASNASTTAFVINGVPYQFPSVQAASGTVLTQNGYGHLSWMRPDWSVLASTSLGSAVATTTLSFPTYTGASDLRVVIDVPSIVTPGFRIQFNADTAAHYNWTKLNSVPTNTSAGPVNFITLNPADSNTTHYLTFEMDNNANRQKIIHGLISSGLTSGAAEVAFFGAVWTDASSQVTSITVANSAPASPLPIGTRITVYGSQQ